MSQRHSYENSLWWSSVEHPTFSPKEIDSPWDIVIIGAGFSGLWCAHHLLNNNPSLSIAVFEQNQVGSGASGRNGGWVSALYPQSDSELIKKFGAQATASLQSHLENSIDEIADFAQTNSIDCGFAKGGTLSIARNKGQLKRIKGEATDNFLNESAIKARIQMQGALGGTYSPHCAAINPAALVIGLALNLQKRGVSIFELTPAYANERSVLVTHEGMARTIKSTHVVEAIEAYRANSRTQIPIYSLMVATEALSQDIWEQIGLRERETFAEVRHMVTYAQRTSDNRLAIGGRGAPYLFGSKRKDSHEAREVTHQLIRELAVEWFPVLKNTRFTHAWGGAVGITRDWAPYVHWDGRLAALGGYAGDGVTLSYVAANSVADLITGKKSERSQLPYVHSRSKNWEFEPLRWFGVNTAIGLSELADVEERITQHPSVLGKIIEKLF